MFRVHMKLIDDSYFEHVLFAKSGYDAELACYDRFKCLHAIAEPATMQIADCARTVYNRLEGFRCAEIN